MAGLFADLFAGLFVCPLVGDQACMNILYGFHLPPQWLYYECCIRSCNNLSKTEKVKLIAVIITI